MKFVIFLGLVFSVITLINCRELIILITVLIFNARPIATYCISVIASHRSDDFNYSIVGTMSKRNSLNNMPRQAISFVRRCYIKLLLAK